MLNLAFFISGRLTCYEEHLIPFLEFIDKKYNVLLFISINGIRDEYHLIAEDKLKRWLAHICYEEYKIPSNMKPNIHPETLFQIVDNKKVPYTNLSCFYNDAKAFRNIIQYEIENNIKCDIYIKFRPDIIFENMNDVHFIKDNEESLIIHTNINLSIHPYGNVTIPPMISVNFDYGNRKSMEIYCNTYNYILEQNELRQGYYRINFETCITESVINYNLVDSTDSYTLRDKIINNSRNIQIDYIKCNYIVDVNRRKLDTTIGRIL